MYTVCARTCTCENTIYSAECNTLKHMKIVLIRYEDLQTCNQCNLIKTNLLHSKKCSAHS